MKRAQFSNGQHDLSATLWYCLLVIIALTGVVLFWRGFDIWTVLLICLALVCPALIVWGLFGIADDGVRRGWRALRDRIQRSR